jgi:hypothetical protein
MWILQYFSAKKCPILLAYIAHYLAPTYFGWSPSLETSQPNTLKLTTTKYSLRCYEYECTDYVIGKGKYILVKCAYVGTKKL